MTLLQMSFAGGVLILAVILLRALTLHRLPKGTFLALWAVAALRLLVPVVLYSPFSVYTVANDQPLRAAGGITTVPAAMVPSATVPAATPRFPAVPATPDSPGVVPAGGAAAAVWPWVWIVGAAVCGAFFLIAYLRCRREFNTALPVEDKGLRAWLAECRLRRTVSLRQSDRVDAPLTYGLFRPVILLPRTWADEPQLEYVLEHELTHIRHLDALWKLALALTACVHWFNPLVWAMYLLANRDIELWCDETVVRRFGVWNSSAYARTLIAMVEKKSGLGPFASAFSKNAIEERIRAIMKTKRYTLPAIIAAVALVCCVAVGFATSARSSASADRNAMLVNTLRDRLDAQDSLGIQDDFTEEEKTRLMSLWVDNYENMTVADYRERVAEKMAEWDNPGDMELIDRYSQNSVQVGIYGDAEATKRANTFHDYFHNIYEPLTAENWQSRTFPDQVANRIDGTAVFLEYTCNLHILDPDKLTVGEYLQAQDDLKAGLEALLGKDPQDSDFVELSQQLSTESLEIAVEAGLPVRSNSPATGQNAAFDALDNYLNRFPGVETTTVDGYLIVNDPDAALYAQSSRESAAQLYLGTAMVEEEREFPRATREDYDSLETLKTDGYEQMSLAAFDQRLLDWANEHQDVWDRINCDMIWNDYEVDQTQFASVSCYFSGIENGMRVRALYTGEPEQDPRFYAAFGRTVLEEYEDGGGAAWCDLYYNISYHIADKSAVTVGERDACVQGMRDAIALFWQDTDFDAMLQMTEADVVDLFNAWAAENSTKNVQINPVTAGDIFFQYADERRVD